MRPCSEFIYWAAVMETGGYGGCEVHYIGVYLLCACGFAWLVELADLG